MAKFTDMFDNKRTVEPIATKGNQHICRVYFDGRYVGNAEIPVRLFDASIPRNQYIGFVAVQDAPAGTPA